ncbi:MAG: hypothetical protein VB031_02155 [Eubacteriaceae bacterium]|nr:hypothetical protein [Eubacteriaceae bacterium]
MANGTNGLNDQSQLDVNKILTGKDGQLIITLSDNTELFLAEVDTAQAQLNMNNTDYQPVGSALVFAVPTGHSITLTMSEVVIRDDVLLTKLYDDLKSGHMPVWDFQCKLRRRGEVYQRQVFRNCLPDGNLDLFNLNPGEIIKRAWSFRVNANPELMEWFNTDGSQGSPQ